MATPRLPTPGEDTGNWGEILNEYLLVAHNNDGTLKAESVILSKANKTYVDSELTEKANISDLAAVATSGSFNDLTDVPVGSDFSSLVSLTGTQTITGEKNFTGGLKVSGVEVATTNDSRLSNTRTPSDDSVTEPKLAVSNSPSNGDFLSWNGTSLTWEEQESAPVSSVNGDIGDVTVTKADVGLGNADNTSDANKPVSTATQEALSEKANSTDLSTVAITGSYSNLLDKPVYSTVATSGSYADLTNKPSLSTVATTGSYADLTNKPTIPTAGVVSGTYAAGDDNRINGAIQKSVTTSKGDILVATASATVDRLGVGGNNQVLTVDNSQPQGIKWADLPAASGGRSRVIQSVSTNMTASSAASTDYVLAVTASVTITLPAVSGSGNGYTIKNISGSVVTVAASGSDQIDAESQMILQNMQSYTLYDIGAATWIVT